MQLAVINTLKYVKMAGPGQKSDGLEVIRPMFWTGFTGSGRKRTIKGRDTARELKTAYNNIIHENGQLTFNEQRELFPYIFWPPIQSWCLVPFDMQACPKKIRASETKVNPLVYGLGAKSSDFIWKHAVLGVFEPERRHYQIFDHILIAVQFPWADESSPDDVPMWGLVHYKKGSDTAYVHVMTEWHESVFNKDANNARWADDLVKTLTGEGGVDDDLFVGNNPRVNIQWVANLTGPDWSTLGSRGESTEEVSDMSYLYIIYAATKLAFHGFQDTAVPAFGADDAYSGLAQALLGVSTALEHGEEGGIQSVGDGISAPVRKDATDEHTAYRELLDERVDVIADEFQKAPGPGLAQSFGLQLSGGIPR